ncbi:MAG: cytochrome c family protein [Pseudomonadota bacterium]
MYSQNKAYLSMIVVILFLGVSAFLWSGNNTNAWCTSLKIYVGMNACKECHEKEYESFMKNARKRHSYESVKKMEKDLTPEELKACYECHTTGYGKPGGFQSESETPHLSIAGCEVCHGPGSLHAKTEKKDDIKSKLTSEDCETCHCPERIEAFNYKPLIYGGAH